MSNYIAKLHTRILQAMDDTERGSLSVEQVIITVGLIAVGVLVVGAITAFVQSKIGSIS